MNKLSETIKKISEKWTSLSMGRKIAVSILALSLIIATVVIGITLGTTKYVALFSELDSSDAGSVIEKLKEKKVEYKVLSDNRIMVPEEQADELRMEMLSEVELTNGSVGWELFNTAGMVATDFENKVKYQRALSGQIERMIKSFDEVKDAKVILVLPEDTVFVRESTPAKAAVSIKLAPGVKKLEKSQIKAIASLLTGSVSNLPIENVHIAVDGMTLATEGLFEEEDNEGIDADKQAQMRKQREEELQEKVLSVLKPTFGSGVNVVVSVDMNFDSYQTESTEYGDGKVVSEQEIITNTKDSDGNVTSSPIDNNMGSTIDDSSNGGSTSEHKETTKNYQVPETKKYFVESPGKVEKISVSVALDESGEKLSEDTKNKVRSTVATAIGYDMDRGDSISIEGYTFKNQTDDLLVSAMEEMKDAEKTEQKEALERKIAYAAGGFIILLIVLVLVKKLNKKSQEPEYEGLDVVIGENIEPKEEEKYNHIDFDGNNEGQHVEKEVRKYASDKPDQVADIVKSWLAEDERW